MTTRFLATILVLAVLAAAGRPAAADESTARRLLISQGCKGCHALDGEGGNLGPALDKVGSRLSTRQIRQKLLDPKATRPDSRMPSFRHLTEPELKALVTFLKNRT